MIIILFICCSNYSSLLSVAPGETWTHYLASESIQVEELDDGVHTLQLPAGEVWPAIAHGKLFVRRVFRKYYDKFIKGSRPKKTITCGTPGIGKSAAGMYFLHRALLEGKTVVYHAAFQHEYTVYHRETLTKVRLFDAGKLLADENVLLIADSIQPPSLCKCAVVLITSPRRDVWVSLSKETNSLQRYLPPPTLTEMKLMREHCFPAICEEEMMEGIRLFGCNPRAVFLMFAGATRVWSETSLRYLIRTQSVQLLMNAASLDSTGKDDPSHRLIYIKATDEFLDGGREFASQFVASLLCEQFVLEEKEKLQAWLQHAGASAAVSELYGRVFEPVSLEIIASGGSFKTMNMITGKFEEEFFPRRGVASCNELPEDLGHRILYRSPHSKYPAIDGITRGEDDALCTFNATIDPAHTVLMLDANQTGGLVMLEEKYKLPKCRFYLLLPEDKFSDVKMMTPQKWQWKNPHKTKVSGGWVPKTFNAGDREAKQGLWGISAVSIPLGKPLPIGGKRLYSTFRTVIRHCLQ